MDQEAFYKDQYDKSLAERTEINGSLSTPIGILTALLAGLYFCVTNFDYTDNQNLTKYFGALAILTSGLLLTSIVYLILAFADFLKSRKYYTINDAEVLNDFYTNSIAYYAQNPPPAPETPESQAEKDFDAYILGEYVRNATINRQTSRVKTALLFQSHKFMIYAIISLSLLIIPFGIDFARNKDKEKVQKIKIDQELPVEISLKFPKDTTLHIKIKPRRHGKAHCLKTHAAAIPDHH